MENIKELEDRAMKIISSENTKKKLIEETRIGDYGQNRDDQDTADIEQNWDEFPNENRSAVDEPQYSVTDFSNFVEKYDENQYETPENQTEKANFYKNIFKDAKFIKIKDDEDKIGNVILKVVDDPNIDDEYIGKEFSVPVDAIESDDFSYDGEPGQDTVDAIANDMEHERMQNILKEPIEPPKDEKAPLSNPNEIDIIKDPTESLSLGDISSLVLENQIIAENCSKKKKTPPFFDKKKSDSDADSDSDSKSKSKKKKRPFWLKKKSKSNKEKLEEARQYGFSK